MPRRSDERRHCRQDHEHVRHDAASVGSTIHAWRITWRNPAGDHHEQQIGRRVGKDVVQIGTAPRRHADAVEFHRDHAGLVSLARRIAEPDGKTWTLEGEFRTASDRMTGFLSRRTGFARSASSDRRFTPPGAASASRPRCPPAASARGCGSACSTPGRRLGGGQVDAVADADEDRALRRPACAGRGRSARPRPSAATTSRPASAGSSNVPMSRLLATPTPGTSSSIDRCDASPQRRGWA